MRVKISVSGTTEIKDGDLADLKKANWEDALRMLRERGAKIEYDVREVYVSDKIKVGSK